MLLCEIYLNTKMRGNKSYEDAVTSSDSEAFMFLLRLLNFQIVHRTLAAMLGSLAALAALAVIGDVSPF